jgi:hypothetical protein
VTCPARGSQDDQTIAGPAGVWTPGCRHVGERALAPPMGADDGPRPERSSGVSAPFPLGARTRLDDREMVAYRQLGRVAYRCRLLAVK